MSYILEALKKAERKRELEERQTSVAFSTEAGKPTKKTAWWPYLLIAVLIVNAFFLVRWVWFSPPTGVPVAAPSPTVADPIAQPSALPPANVQKEEMQAPRIAGSAPRVEQKERAGMGRAAERPGPADRDIPQVPAPSPTATPEPPTAKEVRPHIEHRSARLEPRSAHIEPRSAPVAGKVYGLGELPADVKGSLPEFKISGHAYSAEIQTRVVRINDKILQEGQDLSAGLKLEEITPTGVILSYQGYRFRIGTNYVQ